jgi:phosphopantothenoylcysteine synthetase/decarboxylase
MENEKTSCPEVLITAGGTREQIDDVRYIGNFSGGRLGHALAETYANLGHQVTLLAPKDVPERLGLPEGVNHQPFTSAESLRETMLSIPAARLVLHAAAVSDYTPERTAGKISSDEDELVIRCRRTPKILKALREHFGDKTNIVGFKLLSGVPETELIDTATKQIEVCKTDACIANDLEQLGLNRRLHIVEPGGEYQTIEGDTQSVARQISQALPVREVAYA